jgi:hypothetical protein
MDSTIEQNIVSGQFSKIQLLARKSLQYKWIPNQKQNLNMLLHFCPFCQDALFSKGSGDLCSCCLCPKLVCCDRGNGGFIGYLKNKYGYVSLYEIEPRDYHLMRTVLNTIWKLGKLSEKVENWLSNKKTKKNEN